MSGSRIVEATRRLTPQQRASLERALRRFNGVSTERLPLYVAWFARIERERGDQTPLDTLKLLLAA